MTRLTKNEKLRLGVLYVLLNATTEYNGDNDVICSVMDMIQSKYHDASKMWKGKFKIMVDEKVIYEWDNGGSII